MTNAVKTQTIMEKTVYHTEHMNILFDCTINSLYHAFATVASLDNDIYYLSEVFKQPNMYIYEIVTYVFRVLIL